MAARLADVVEEMKQTIRDGSRQGSDMLPGQLADKILALAAGFLLKALARDVDRGQVAILMADKEHHQMTFAYPPYLARGNVFPIDRNSLAGQVIVSGQAMLLNNVVDEPHKDFFERIPDQAGRVRPIQKMIAAPMLQDGEAIGVIEVSRAGRTGAEAGGDFTPEDSRNLEKCCRVFAPFVARTWTSERGW